MKTERMLGTWAQLPTQLSLSPGHYYEPTGARGLGSKAGWLAGRRAVNSEAAAALADSG